MFSGTYKEPSELSFDGYIFQIILAMDTFGDGVRQTYTQTVSCKVIKFKF